MASSTSSWPWSSATARRFLSALDLLGPAMIAAVGVGLFFLTY